jgi:TRAP-type C4-dicarboxylate transport system permease large subunit
MPCSPSCSTRVSGDLETMMVIIEFVVIVAGFLIDGAILILMLTSIFLRLGGDLVNFGIIFIIAATIGNFTSPVGAAMFAICAITIRMIFTPALVLWILDPITAQ